MKKTPINALPDGMPNEIISLAEGAAVFDSSSSPEARVYFIEKDCGYFLKSARFGELGKEAAMSRYFHSKGLAPEVLFYTSAPSGDLMLTKKAVGEDCTHKMYLDDPKRLAALLGERLRTLHELDASGCPVQNRNADYLAYAEKNYIKGQYDLSFFHKSGATADEVFSFLDRNKSILGDNVLLHGDFCLPNIILDGWRFSAFIDVGNGGVGDRHIDLFWGVWTLNFNLKTNKFKDIFLDAYGRDKAREEILPLISAAEVFG